ncbi:MAG: [protein-PII] uridylyltransferase [Gammaproteobacteria bacterium]|jgi:[protein-PII] uridylyltransferase|nr:[protein-PII] uridylyltransferase [Gammaproteobacteria bacterium]
MATQTGSITSLLKQALETGTQHLDDIFQASRHTRVVELVNARAWLTDRILTLLWQQYSWPEGAALVAVGGYGRGELHPHSDIDLLILIDDQEPLSSWEASAQQFVTALWDLGVVIGSSVRTYSECQTQAKGDITIATNLIESRAIVGKPTLRKQLFRWLMSDDAWSDEDFYKARIKAQQDRYQRTNETEYNLEPNLKSSPGGLRDIQTITWIGKRHFGLRYMRDLYQHDFITEDELGFFYRAIEYLWTIRYALHLQNRRPEDRLLFDQQRKLAAFFGYEDNDQALAVEQFMRKYYRVAMRLAELNQTLLQLFDQAILRAHQPDTIVQVNRRFEIRNNLLEAKHQRVFIQQPFALMEAYVILAQHPDCSAIGAATQRLIRTHRPLMDDKLRKDIRVNSLFMELLRSPKRMSHTLIDMQRIGLLASYLPAFDHITGQMQHDLFHIYTVDAHTLKMVKRMREMLLTRDRQRFPIATRVVHELPKIELLYIAGLYHDIAKGKGGDHSRLGAEEVKEFCHQHHLGTWDTDLVSWLIRHHLLMSMTAQKRDIGSPEVIHEFAAIVGDELHLDYLYVMTVCDIYATNPELWNNWRASLMRQLYTETNRVLRLGLDLDTPIDHASLIEQTQIDARKLLLEKRLNPAAVQNLWQQLGDDYFIRERAATVAWHTQQILGHQSNTPLVAISEFSFNDFEGGSQIFVYTKDQPNLFAAMCAIIGQLNLNIFDARIITTDDGYSMDTFIVLDKEGQTLDQTAEVRQQLQDKLTRALQHPKDFAYLVEQRTPRLHKLFTIPTQVNIANPKGFSWTRVELICADRPGLLAQVGLVFMRLGISIQKAKIQSMGERVEDVFFITDMDGERIVDNEILQCLQQQICCALDSHISQAQ